MDFWFYKSHGWVGVVSRITAGSLLYCAVLFNDIIASGTFFRTRG